MQAAGVKPDDITFSTLVSTASESCLVQAVRRAQKSCRWCVSAMRTSLLRQEAPCDMQLSVVLWIRIPVGSVFQFDLCSAQLQHS